MKKYLLVLLICSLAFTFTACGKVDNSIIAGNWTSNRTVKTELRYDQDDPTSVYGYFYINQSISYNFDLDNTFSKKVNQVYTKTEIIPGFESLVGDQLENVEQYLQSLNSAYVITGKYELSKKKIAFTAENYNVNGEDYTPDFVKENAQYLLLQTVPSKYSVEPGKLLITDELGNLTEFKTDI